jgi:hypothetical protein
MDLPGSGAIETDHAGRFRALVNPGPWVVVASLPGEPLRAAAAAVSVTAVGGEVRVTIGGTERIAGTALDDNARPVAGVPIWAIPETSSLGPEGRAVANGTSGADGQFTIDGVDGGRYQLFVRGDSTWGPTDQAGRGLPAAAGQRPLTLRVRKQSVLRGRVMVERPGQDPVVPTSFQVASTGFGQHGFSSRDGRFSVPMRTRASKVPVFFSVESLTPALRYVTIDGDEHDLGDVVIGPGRTVRGRIVDPRGAGVSRARLSLGTASYSLGGTLARSMGDGSFEASMPSGDVPLLIQHDSWLPTERLVRAGENQVEIRLAQGARLRLRVVDADGSPLAGVSVRALHLARSRTCTTDANGRCQVVGLSPGEHWILPGTVSGLDPNRVAPPTLHLQLLADEERGVQVRWPREASRLTVRVLDPDGRPSRSGARLVPGEVSFSEVVEPNGTWKVPFFLATEERPIENLPPDRYTVIALGPWGMPACALASVDIRGGDEKALTLRLGDGSCR